MNVSLAELDIREGLTDTDCSILRQLVNAVSRPEMTVIEVGSWKGHSTSILVESVLPYNGHDCEGYYTDYIEEIRKMIDSTLEVDFTSGVHSGVVRALYEHFGRNYYITGSGIWFYQKLV